MLAEIVGVMDPFFYDTETKPKICLQARIIEMSSKIHAP